MAIGPIRVSEAPSVAHATMAATQAASVQQSEAFRRLYPEEFYARFVAEGVRPDGRPLGRPRPVSIGLNSISTADASALVKVRTVSPSLL